MKLNFVNLMFFMPLNIESTTEEKVHIKITPTTTSGNPAALDGTPVWTVDPPATVEPDADGLGAFIISADAAGVSNWKVEADADLGEGVQTITDGGVYTYNHPQAANLGVVADAPVPK
jgi:hypothetical protein